MPEASGRSDLAFEADDERALPPLPKVGPYIGTDAHTSAQSVTRQSLPKNLERARGIFYARRSYHLATKQPPKTKRARRTIELLPRTVRVLRALALLHV